MPPQDRPPRKYMPTALSTRVRQALHRITWPSHAHHSLLSIQKGIALQQLRTIRRGLYSSLDYFTVNVLTCERQKSIHGVKITIMNSQGKSYWCCKKSLLSEINKECKPSLRKSSQRITFPGQDRRSLTSERKPGFCS